MLSKWPIRDKLLFGTALLVVIVATLAWSGFHGVYAYRSLVKGLSGRAAELPIAARLSQQTSDLRVAVSDSRASISAATTSLGLDQAEFASGLRAFRATLKEYAAHLSGNAQTDSRIGDCDEELRTVDEIHATLKRIDHLTAGAAWMGSPGQLGLVSRELKVLQSQTSALPRPLHQRIEHFALEVRTQYRTLIVLTWITTASAALMLLLFARLFYTWVFRPLRVLIKGSRRVAAGEFGYRIKLETHDEMAELAAAMNDMTARFQAVRDDLDRQVQERTKQVVRSEQLASVGFLAAGVSHEINNPLASIALCAESLEGRVQDLFEAVGPEATGEHDVIRNYLRMIQEEAFRCKGITERLLDFSRMGDVTRQNADLGELVQGVIEMVGHLGKYHDKQIHFAADDPVIAPINPQEFKQVVLNLITNGLDSLSPGGVVSIHLARRGNRAELTISDNGCGMTDEVREHLFEPFFTRRRTGQGIGLGLSITYRIVADHGGQIDVHSDGPGKGSKFVVSLPLAEKHKESDHRYQAA